MTNYFIFLGVTFFFLFSASDLVCSGTILQKTQFAATNLAQEHFKEADAVLKPLCSMRPSQLSHEEKESLFLALQMRDEALSSLYEKAKRLINEDQIDEATSLLETLLPLLQSDLASLQYSPLYKRKHLFAVSFTLVECYTRQKKNGPALDLIKKLEKEPPNILSARFATKLNVLKNMIKEEPVQPMLNNHLQHDPTDAPYIALWNVQSALSKPNQEPLPEAFQQLLSGNALRACERFKDDFPHIRSYDTSFQKRFLEGYQEALWMRCLICFFADKNDVFENCIESANHISDLLESLHMPSRRICFQALYLMKHFEPLPDVACPSPSHPSTALLMHVLHGNKIDLDTLLSLPLLDRLFLHTVALYTKHQTLFEPTPIFYNDMDKQYPCCTCLSAIAKANDPSSDWEREEKELTQILANDSLSDTHPKLLHLLFSHKMRTGAPKAEIDALAQTFLTTSVGYGKKHEALWEYFIYLDTHPQATSEEKKHLIDILNQDPLNEGSMLCLLYAQETGQLSFYSFSPTFKPFLQILECLDEAKKVQKELEKVQDPGLRIERIRKAKASFQSADEKGREYLQNPLSMEETSIAASLETKIISLWAEMLFNETLFDHSFVDVETYLKEVSDAAENARLFLGTRIRDITRQPKITTSLQEIKDTTDIVTSTCKGDFEEASRLLRKVAPETFFLSPFSIKSALFLAQTLRKKSMVTEAWPIIKQLNEAEIKHVDVELAFLVAIEKSLCLKEKGNLSQAMACLAWVINDSSASSLRIKAMVLRADLYMQVDRPELALRQLEAARGKGGQWGEVAERKLKDLYGSRNESLALYNNK